MKKFLIIAFLFFLNPFNTFADDVHFVDFRKVLNSSKAGSEVQKKLKSKFESESKRFTKIESEIKKEELEIINQKKILNKEEYEKKIQALRNKVTDFQKNKKKSINKIAKSRNDAKQALLIAANPIIRKYMLEKKIRIVLDKKAVLMGDLNLEITDQIISILNKEIPSLKIN